MTTATQATDALAIEALRDKYRAERDKRLRSDGNEQYVEVSGDFSHYIDDPYVEPGFSRAPVQREVEVVLIGGGFGGLQAGARLREAGVEDIVIIEKGGDFGGTWYWNRYPGAQCDVESYVYLPLLEELNYIPTQKYAQAPEILAHSRAIARHYRLYDDALLQTEVKAMQWDEQSCRWQVTTNRGDVLAAHFIAMANGPLNRPKLPGIPGIERFRGHSFHTSRWDYDYTGGDANGGLEKLRDKRVAIIGTGATAVQCVPHLAATAQQLYVFQRTPSGIDVRDNSPTDPQWAAGLEPGWQRARMENFNALVSGVPQAEDLVNDGWTDIIGKTLRMLHEGAADDAGGRSIAETLELANAEKMNEIRARCNELIADPATADKLKPWYAMFCKRPCFHDEYLQSFNRDNVTLVDTDGQGVTRINEHSIVAGGHEYEVDCIIYATGFEVGTSYARRAGYEMIGSAGRSLTDKWNEGITSLHGMAIHEFPNCFIMSQMQGGFTVNYPHMLDELAVHIAHIVSHAQQHGIKRVEATSEAEQDWTRTIVDKGMNGAVLGGETCTPGYYNNEGKPNPLAAQAAPYGEGPIAFFEILRQWRAAGDFSGLQLDKADAG